MAITHTTLYNSGMNDTNATKVAAIYNAILEAYPWKPGSDVTVVSNDMTLTYAVYYFTADSYIKISNYVPHNQAVKIEIVTPNGTKTVKLDDCYYTFSLGKTSKGICICAYSGGNVNTRDPHFYNIYVGEVTHLDGTTTKGCIYVNDDNSYIVATDKGISEESAFVSTIDNTRKAQLVAAADSTTGAIFNDIYMMFNTPLQYNKMKILGTGKTFLLGKSLYLAD